MPLKITTASEVIEVKTLCMTIYAQPGLGKTSLAFTSSNPLLLDFDGGAHRVQNRKDIVQVAEWADVAGITDKDLEPYDTIVLDTVGKALDVLSADVIKKNARHAYGGALNQQGWGQLGVRFGAFLRHLRSMGKDVVLIAHMTEKPDGEQMKERLKIAGGSQDLVLTDSDVIGRISIIDKHRNLVFAPTETAFGKDPAGIEVMPLPDVASPDFPTCLAGILDRVKEGMNALSEEQIERKGEVDWFELTLPTIVDAEGINALLGRAKKAGKDVSKMLVDRAGEMGLEYDAETRGYVYLEELTPEEPGPDEGDEISADAA